MKSLFMNTKKQLMEHKSLIFIVGIYLFFLLFSGIYFLISMKIRNALMSLLFMLFVPAIFIIENWLKIEFGPLFCLCALFIASGAILGACFDFYHLIPFFDDILHILSGFIFACLGYSLIQVFFSNDYTKRKFFGSIIFGAIFSLAIGLFWELIEYTLNVLFGFDMLADTIIYDFNSYLLSGTHLVYEEIDNISKTIIYYGNNEILELNGYLDIGLVDTMSDMIDCFLGACSFIILTLLSNLKFKKFNELFLPKLIINN